MEKESKKSRYTPSQKKAIEKYKATKADLRTWITPEQKEIFKECATKENKSLNQFVIDCILEHINSTDN